MLEKQRILIVGGVAGGASCAARARRLSESADIIMFDRGPYVSFANCGLPYYIGDVIKKEDDLLVATPELFRDRFNIDVRLRTEVIGIDRDRHTIEVMDLETQTSYQEPYDALVLSPGAQPIKPNLTGIDLPGIFSLRTIPDSRQIRAWIDQYQACHAVIVGGGYIGMEIAENLHQRGVQLAIIERMPQVMPLLDPEMVAPVQESLAKSHIGLHLNESASGFYPRDGQGLHVALESGGHIDTDMVVMCVGVRPETDLARRAGLTIGDSGGIWVDDHMRTSDPRIWAVGDAVEVRDAVTGTGSVIPLAGPANRQGRIAADVIMGRDSTFRGVQGTSVVGILDQVVAFTGASEKTLRRLGRWDHMEKIYLHPNDHAGYYPGAEPITLKLIFDKQDGRVMGAQAVGKKGVEKRIDVIAMAIQKNSTVYDLEEAELCYAPAFGSAKDPVNMAGMIAANVLRGDSRITHWEDLSKEKALILDVRDPLEYRLGHMNNATHIPLNQIRDRMDELPDDRNIAAYCYVGVRSYYATRILLQNGYSIKNISGGYRSYLYHQASEKATARK
jgi:NADPH-dependent 2,4-dienoyl-CoA reductase/sulfur reductase-like enzyme/rhodanese-related sulfurtransferase